jgi:hypothetical protein
MRALKRGEIFEARDLPREFVATPEWANGDPAAGVWVQAFNGATRARFARHVRSLAEAQEKDAAIPLARERLIAFACVDEAGEPLFTEEDIPALAKRSDAVLERVATVAQRLNTIGHKAEEEARKNSTAIPSSSSGSESPKPSAGDPSPSGNAA